MLARKMRLGLFVAAMLAAQGCGKKNDSAGAGAGSEPAAAKAGGEGAETKAADDKTEKAAPAATGPLATVNGVSIPRDEFEKKYAKMTKAFTTRNKEIPEGLARRYKESILKQIIDKELLGQKIKAANVQTDAAELDREFEDYKKMFRTEQNFDRYLKSSDISVEQIKENIAHNLAVQKLLEQQGDLAVTDEEVKAYYDENQKRYEVKEQVRASHILLKVNPKDDKKADAEAKKKADEIYKEASKKDADFAELAKKHSQGPTASRGGDLSFFTRGRMVPAFEKVAFEMKAGEVSKPVKTQFGWHIIKVTDRKEGRQRPFDEVKESIEKLLRNKKSRKAKAELLKKLRDDAKVETFVPELAAEAGDDKGAKMPALKRPGGKPVEAPAMAPAAGDEAGDKAGDEGDQQ
ncbi:MAG: peptidylprolyl isomerase [Myxococcales bacterium]|nr:peptidylprolyl isomerase [Myxococcales bacterium]MCB9539097.1 peptidylprolyl isomerase [Myxococcales bacterium]